MISLEEAHANPVEETESSGAEVDALNPWRKIGTSKINGWILSYDQFKV